MGVDEKLEGWDVGSEPGDSRNGSEDKKVPTQPSFRLMYLSSLMWFVF